MNALRTLRSRPRSAIALLLVCCVPLLSSSSSPGANCAKQCKMLDCWRFIKKGEKTTVGYKACTKANDSSTSYPTCNPLRQPGVDRWSVNADNGTCQENQKKNHVFMWKTLKSDPNCDNEPKAGSTDAYFQGVNCTIDKDTKMGDDIFLWECKTCQTP
jgi:hypothetical protein